MKPDLIVPPSKLYCYHTIPKSYEEIEARLLLIILYATHIQGLSSTV